MQKKKKILRQEWDRYLALIALTGKLERELEDNKNCAGCDQWFLIERFLESTAVYYFPSFKNCLKAAWGVLKQAFCRKNRKSILVINS